MRGAGVHCIEKRGVAGQLNKQTNLEMSQKSGPPGPQDKKKVHTVRFEKGKGDESGAKEKGDRSRFYVKDGSEFCMASVCTCM